jgi:hypothetical protein
MSGFKELEVSKRDADPSRKRKKPTQILGREPLSALFEEEPAVGR